MKVTDKEEAMIVDYAGQEVCKLLKKIPESVRSEDEKAINTLNEHFAPTMNTSDEPALAGKTKTW